LPDLLTRLFRWFGYITHRDEVLAITSWRPWRGPYGWEWPGLRVDIWHGTSRKVITPVWERGRILNTLRGAYRG